MKTSRILPILALVPWLLASTARAETRRSFAQALASGVLSNPTAQPQEIVVGSLTVPGVARMRVPLSAAALGTASKVRFTSLQDGQSQTLDADQLAMWSNTSALFNGDTVRVELILAPGDRDVSVRVKQVFTFDNAVEASKGADCCGGVEKRTLCGPDNRVLSQDNRVGRIGGTCTGWLVANGAVLTAGHCGIAGGSIFEVNVPASQANGATVAAAMQDQFPVIAGSITTVNSGVGNDWTVCRLGPNSLGQSAHQLHGFLRMTRELPGAGFTLRVTGCGIDNSPLGSQPGVCGNVDGAGNCTHFGLNAQSQRLQTALGTFTGETGSGTVISLQYAVDTEPANSGSPVIWEGTGFAIGIHTAGGCTAMGGANNGTSFELDALENAIAAVPGPNCRYLDRVKAPSGAEDGTVFQPHDSLAEALNAVPAGGRLSIVASGYYGGAGTVITKAMTISAPVGAVILGN